MRSWHCHKLAQKKQSCQGTHVSFASFPASSNTFNPLFKVLFIFPSRYLFAIGLAHICSCRWNLPPVLRSSPKERDSMKSTVHNDMHMTHRTFTFLDIIFQEAFMRTVAGHSSPKNNSKADGPNSHAELVHVHSPLLVKSHLVFDPPLTYMLKFSGCTYLISYFQSSL